MCPQSLYYFILFVKFDKQVSYTKFKLILFTHLKNIVVLFQSLFFVL